MQKIIEVIVSFIRKTATPSVVIHVISDYSYVLLVVFCLLTYNALYPLISSLIIRSLVYTHHKT